MTYNWRVGIHRGPNLITANPQRIESEDGTRWACGRNVKGEGVRPGTYVGVEIWTLKCRVFGKAVTVKDRCDRAEADAWIAGSSEVAPQHAGTVDPDVPALRTQRP